MMTRRGFLFFPGGRGNQPTYQGETRMGKKDDKADVELNALTEGLRAIHSGDVAGGADALRFAQDIQQERDRKSQNNDRKK